MNNRKLEYPRFLIEYQKCTNLTYYQHELSISFMLIGLIIILKTLNKFY